MKLRFGIDASAYDRIRDALDAASREPPVGKRLSYVYLDTPEGELAERGVALRFRRSAAVGGGTRGRGWKRQLLWPRAGEHEPTLKSLGVPRLKQRVDAAFSIRIERWTWRPNSWADVSLDRVSISTGRSSEDATEIRIRCRKKRREAAMELAVELGAVLQVSRRARERGRDLLLAERTAASPR